MGIKSSVWGRFSKRSRGGKTGRKKQEVGITYKTAWRFTDKMRVAELHHPGDGTIVIFSVWWINTMSFDIVSTFRKLLEEEVPER